MFYLQAFKPALGWSYDLDVVRPKAAFHLSPPRASTQIFFFFVKAQNWAWMYHKTKQVRRTNSILAGTVRKRSSCQEDQLANKLPNTTLNFSYRCKLTTYQVSEKEPTSLKLLQPTSLYNHSLKKTL